MLIQYKCVKHEGNSGVKSLLFFLPTAPGTRQPAGYRLGTPVDKYSKSIQRRVFGMQQRLKYQWLYSISSINISFKIHFKLRYNSLCNQCWGKLTHIFMYRTCIYRIEENYLLFVNQHSVQRGKITIYLQIRFFSSLYTTVTISQYSIYKKHFTQNTSNQGNVGHQRKVCLF